MPFFVPEGLTDEDAPHDQAMINGKFKRMLKREHHKYHVAQVQKYMQQPDSKAVDFKFDAMLLLYNFATQKFCYSITFATLKLCSNPPRRCSPDNLLQR